MSDIQSYKDLIIWQRAMNLAESSYRLTSNFPKDELFGMTSQIRRSAVSVAANIAEGHGRDQTGSFIQFLRIAQGSLKELETHLLLAERVNLTNAAKPLTDECEEIGRMLRTLIRNLQAKSND
jgi:four helix bundle protein